MKINGTASLSSQQSIISQSEPSIDKAQSIHTSSLQNADIESITEISSTHSKIMQAPTELSRLADITLHHSNPKLHPRKSRTQQLISALVKENSSEELDWLLSARDYKIPLQTLRHSIGSSKSVDRQLMKAFATLQQHQAADQIVLTAKETSNLINTWLHSEPEQNTEHQHNSEAILRDALSCLACKPDALSQQVIQKLDKTSEATQKNRLAERLLHMDTHARSEKNSLSPIENLLIQGKHKALKTLLNLPASESNKQALTQQMTIHIESLCDSEKNGKLISPKETIAALTAAELLWMGPAAAGVGYGVMVGSLKIAAQRARDQYLGHAPQELEAAQQEYLEPFARDAGVARGVQEGNLAVDSGAINLDPDVVAAKDALDRAIDENEAALEELSAARDEFGQEMLAFPDVREAFLNYSRETFITAPSDEFLLQSKWVNEHLKTFDNTTDNFSTANNNLERELINAINNNSEALEDVKNVYDQAKIVRNDSDTDLGIQRDALSQAREEARNNLPEDIYQDAYDRGYQEEYNRVMESSNDYLDGFDIEAFNENIQTAADATAEAAGAAFEATADIIGASVGIGAGFVALGARVSFLNRKHTNKAIKNQALELHQKTVQFLANHIESETEKKAFSAFMPLNRLHKNQLISDKAWQIKSKNLNPEILENVKRIESVVSKQAQWLLPGIRPMVIELSQQLDAIPQHRQKSFQDWSNVKNNALETLAKAVADIKQGQVQLEHFDFRTPAAFETSRAPLQMISNSFDALGNIRHTLRSRVMQGCLHLRDNQKQKNMQQMEVLISNNNNNNNNNNSKEA